MAKKKGQAKNKAKVDNNGADDNGVNHRRTLVVDVGGSGIKATLLNDLGKGVGERVRRDSPASGMPGEVMDIIISLSKQFESFDRVAVGFPGVVINGIVKQAPNLAKEWQDVNIAEALEAGLKKPVRVANDADVQGFGAIAGTGVELVVTLGTGVGTSLFVDGRLVPNLEIGRGQTTRRGIGEGRQEKVEQATRQVHQTARRNFSFHEIVHRRGQFPGRRCRDAPGKCHHCFEPQRPNRGYRIVAGRAGLFN